MLDPTQMGDDALMEDAPVQAGMTDDELVAALQREYAAADSYHDDLRTARELNRRYYEAKPFGNEETGRSQIVLPDVQEAVDYMVPSVIKQFVAGGNVVEFEATDEESEDGAEEATQAIQYSFMRLQDGERILHDMLTDGLIERTGIVKTTMEQCEKVTRQQVQITDPVQLEGVDGEIEDVAEQPDGSAIVTLKVVKKSQKFIDVPVQPEHFRFSPLANHEDNADYLAHVEPRTRSDLVDMGFDRDQVYSLPAYSYIADDARRNDVNYTDTNSSPAMEKVLLCEEYASIDRDGDGIAERIKVFRVENEILIDGESGELSLETVEDQPFTVFCPYPRPHRLVGYSLAEKVMDIQLSRSTVARQLMDGMYNANMPRPVVTESGMSENTIDDLLSPIPGSPIRVKTLDAVQPYQTAFDVGKSLSVMEWMSGERESRTGITRLNQGLDADALNNVGVSTTNRLQDKGEQQEEFVARNMAWALVRMFGKKYRLMKAEGQPFNIKVDGQYKQVNPANWPDEVNIVPRVGLGSGSKDRRIQYRMSLVPIMAEGIAAGQVSPKNSFKMIDGLVRDMQLGTGDDFWIDPDAPPEIDPNTGQPKQPAPEKPDPEMVKVQAEAQANQQKAALAQQESQQKIELASQESEARLAVLHNEGQQKIQLEADKAAQAQRLADQKAEFEANLATETAERNYQLALMQEANRHELATRQADHSHEIAKMRPGGDLSK